MEILQPSESFDYLQEIINTMHKVNDYNGLLQGNFNQKAKFKMQDFVLPSYLRELNNLCGTTGCICGYQAIVENPKEKCAFELGNLALGITYKLRKRLGENIAFSIYSTTAERRRKYAKKSKRLNVDFRHLQCEYPTIEDAIEYMKYIQTICKEQM